eukprot:scaffold1610_cov39-Cyclotella_meneghiniana.AAC.2
MRFTLHHLQQNNMIRPSGGLNQRSVTDYHADSPGKRTDSLQIMTKEKSDDLNDSDIEVAELEELDVVREPADMVDNDNVGKLCCFARWFGKGGGEGALAL